MSNTSLYGSAITEVVPISDNTSPYSTIAIGVVSDTNTTSLYSGDNNFISGVVSSSVFSVNGGVGVTVNPTTGNVVVSIGQDVATTANVTFADVTATGNLSNAYFTLANSTGTNGQVLTTDGAGVTTWTTPSSLGLVSSVTGSGAGINVSPTTGAVVVSNTGVTSIVAGTNISISGATGAVTINAVGFGTGDVTGPASATDNAIVRFDGTTGKLIQNSTVTIADTTGDITTNGDIAVNGGDITTTQAVASLFNTTATTVNVGNGANTELNLGSPTGGSKVVVKSENLVGVNAVQNVFNTVATTINLGNGADTEVNIGSPTGGSKVVIKPETIVGINATQAVFNTVATTVNAFGAATTVNIAAAYPSTTTLGGDGVVNGILKVLGDAIYINYDNTATDSVLSFKGVSAEYLKWNNTDTRFETSDNLLSSGWLGAQADVIYINWDDTAIDSYLSFKGINNEYIKWNNTDTRFEFSDQIYNSQTDIPAIFERRNVTADINNALEFKSGLRLTQRVTDAADNDTLAAGPGITFTRTSGATATTERIFASLGAVWDGATQTVDWGFNWSNDDLAEPTPGNFPGTYTLLRMGSYDTNFYNNSVYIDYGAPGTNHTATSIITSNTLVFGVAHGFSSGDRIQYTSTTQNGLTQNAYYYVIAAGLTATQCQLGLTANGSAIALTNGTGLTLVFVDLINQVGINTGTPDYTLDVNGTTNSVGNLTVQAENITINDNKANVNVNLNFGRVAPSTNAVIRWNSATNIFEWSEDGTTWHQFIDATLTAPFYNGQMLTYRIDSSAVGEWINDNRVSTTDAGQRNVFEYRPLSPTAGVNTSLFLRKNYSNSVEGTPGVGTYADGAGVSLSFQVDSDTQATASYANITGVYSATVPTVSLRTSIDNGTTTPSVGDFTTVNASIPGSLTIESRSDIDTAPLTTTAITQVPLITSTRNVMKAVVYIVQGTDVHTVEALVLRTGASTAMVTTYAEMYNTSSLATFAADTSGGAIRLLVTPANATSMLFTSVITSLT
jgi:hypothetical protein